MKKAFALTLVLALEIFLSCPAPAEKFQSSFSQDYMTQTSNQDIKPQLPAAPSLPAKTSTTPTAMQDASLATTPAATALAPAAEAPATNAPILSGPQDVQLPDFRQKSMVDIQKPKITVPDYERQYREMFVTQAEKAARRRKKLIESIMDEITRYGVYIIFGFVILVMIIAVRKETPGGAPPQQPPPEDDAKNIWKEDF